MKILTGVVGMCVCMAVVDVSPVRGAEAGSLAEITERLRTGASSIEEMMEALEKQLEIGSEIQERLNEERRGRSRAERGTRAEERAAAAAGRKLAGQEKRLAALKRRAGEIREQLAEIEGLRAELDGAGEQRRQAEARTKTAEAAREKAEGELARLTGEIAAIEHQIDEMDASVFSHRTWYGRRVHAGRRLESDIARAMEERKQASKRADEAAAERKAAEGRFEQANADIAGMKQRLDAARKRADDVQSLRAKLADEEQRIKDYESAASENRSARLSMEREAARLRRREASLQKQLARLEKELEKQQKDPLRAELKKISEHKTEAEKMLEREREITAGLLAEISAHKDAVGSLEAEKASLEKSIRRLEDDYSEAAARVDGASLAREKVERELEASKQLNRELASQLHHMVADAPADTILEPDDILAVEERIVADARRELADPASEALAKSDASYRRGIAKWDEGDIDGAIGEFIETVRLNPDAAGALYNLGLAHWRKGESRMALDYAYQAGRCYLRNGNEEQALRMIVFMNTIDSSSPLIEELRSAISSR